MSTATLARSAEETSQPRLRGDSLAESVLLLLAMMVVQRLLGFGRGILFCRWLDAEQLGSWDVAYGFLQLAAPLAVLGLPGSFGRYVEHYRQRGHLKTFLSRTAAVSAAMALVASVTLAVAREPFSQLIFGRTDEAPLVGWIAVSLSVFIFHNFLTSLFIAVRCYRIVSALQFFQSLLFALFSIPLLMSWKLDAESIVLAFGLSCLLCCLGSLPRLRELWSTDSSQPDTLPQRSFWAKLMPFALWIWVTNLLFNLFEVCDRYLIVHYSGLEPTDALRMVGNYHSSRIIPVLFVGIAGMIGAMITPHLSCDWEKGNRRAVIDRLNMVTKTTAMLQFAASIAVVLAAPLLFEVAFRNKLSGGMQVLPWTLAYCGLFGLFAISQNYLWCVEKAGLSSLSLLLGLIVGIGASLVLLPIYGLHGAVWAATCANVVALGTMYVFSQLLGMRFDRGTWVATFAPLSVGFGLWPALTVLLFLTVVTVTTNQIYSAVEKQQLRKAALSYVNKVRQLFRRRVGSACADALAQ